MQINEYHGEYNTSCRNGTQILYIVVHYTAGSGSARNNCVYFSGGNRNASADYFVDDDGVWEYNDPGAGRYTWHCGDGHGAYGITNANSVGIEVVSESGLFTEAEVCHLAELVPHLMARFGVPAERVVRHFDASRKLCPAGYCTDDAWYPLWSRVTGGAAPEVEAAGAGAGGLAVDGWWGTATTRALQRHLGTTEDGTVSHQWPTDRQDAATTGWEFDGTLAGSQVVRALQGELGVDADGLLGTVTVCALQRRMGTTVDGYLSGPSDCVREMQRRLNAGTL